MGTLGTAATALFWIGAVVAPFECPLKEAKVHIPRGNLAHGAPAQRDADTGIMRIALYQPDIPQNTGTILRLGACLNVAVDIIGPSGFDLSDRALKRAGLDYAEHATLRRYDSWEDFEETRRSISPRPRLVLLTTRAQTSHLDFEFHDDDILLLGRESSGAPEHVHAAADARIRIPIRAGSRSLNLAIACAIVTGEALRQTGWR